MNLTYGRKYSYSMKKSILLTICQIVTLNVISFAQETFDRIEEFGIYHINLALVESNKKLGGHQRKWKNGFKNSLSITFLTVVYTILHGYD